MVKIGRNEQCPCNSGKKYKKCCLAKNESEAMEFNNMMTEKLTAGDPLTEKLHRLNQYLLDRYQIRVVNLTNYLVMDLINRINTMYSNKRNIVIAAERNDVNEKFFQTKSDDEACDMIVIYCNNYLCFNYDNEWDDMIERLDTIINPKGKGKRTIK